MAAKSKARNQSTVLKQTMTLEERYAAGKALRDKASRKAHAGWKPPANRRDPIDLLIETSEGRVPQLIPIRYGRMMQTPFTFYRGAAAIMARDLSKTPASGIRVQACGDCHLLNFGAYATPERRVIFDINDFDETLPAPWEWDVKRLAASFVIAGRNNGFKESLCRESAATSVRSYREHIADMSKMNVMDRWYDRIDFDDLLERLRDPRAKKRVQKELQKQSSRSVLQDDFPKLASFKGGKARINDNPPLIFHPDDTLEAEFEKVLRHAFDQYLQTLSDDRRALIKHFQLHDWALKVVGVGSVGTRCGILLLMAGHNDPLFLQVKEARHSVLEPYAGKSVYKNQGERVVAGQRLMQSASDLFLGWTEGREGRCFYIRQLRDIKIKPVVEAYDDHGMDLYAEFCGWALARAHAKSGDPGIISGYLGNSDRFDDAVSKFALDYADQNEKDHSDLLKAIRAGKITVHREV